jgi:hypothetical protein
VLAPLAAVPLGQAPRGTSAAPGVGGKQPASPAAREPSSPGTTSGKWRIPGVVRQANAELPVTTAAAPPAAAPAAAPPALNPVTPAEARAPIARVTPGSGALPNDQGQQWRDYDISPYTARVTSTNRPEQAIRDWILRETGYEAWHGEIAALLCCNQRTLSVYHTPAMQAIVQEMVDRFVNTEAESQAFGMRVITLGSPNWRGPAHRMLRPVAAQSPGVQAWLLAKEDASLLVNDLAKRRDFQEHSTPHLVVNNGQSTIVAKTRTRNFLRDIVLTPTPFPGFEPQMGQIDEGFKFEFHPLLSLDGRVIDAVLKCEVDQVEKMLSVTIPVPTAVVRTQSTRVEVPQLISTRMHERFRWPADQVLLISLGVGPTPVPQAPNTLSVPLLSGSNRADLLVFVESRGKLAAPATAPATGPTAVGKYPGRY